MTKKYGYVKCRICGKRVRYPTDPKYIDHDPNRLKYIRRHYKRKHPKAFREMYEKMIQTKRKRGLIK